MKNRKAIVAGAIAGILLALIVIGAFFAGAVFEKKKNERFFPIWEKRRVFRDYVPGKAEGHGIIGTIDSIGSNTLVIKDQTNALKTVLVDEQTQIRQGYMPVGFSDLKQSDRVIVLGNPKDDVLQAKAIRVIGNYGENNKRQP